VVSDGSRRHIIAGGRPMDVEPEVHPLPDLRGFLQLLRYIDAWDLALVQVANEGSVESHLRRDSSAPRCRQRLSSSRWIA
jgi:hypothetical protein